MPKLQDRVILLKNTPQSNPPNGICYLFIDGNGDLKLLDSEGNESLVIVEGDNPTFNGATFDSPIEFPFQETSDADNMLDKVAMARLSDGSSNSPAPSNNVDCAFLDRIQIAHPDEVNIKDYFIRNKSYNGISDWEKIWTNGNVTSGSNSDGKWVEFPNGYIICTQKIAPTTTGESSGNIGRSDSFTFSFPRTFTNIPDVSFMINDPGVNAFGMKGSIGTSGMNTCRTYAIDSSSLPDELSITAQGF